MKDLLCVNAYNVLSKAEEGTIMYEKVVAKDIENVIKGNIPAFPTIEKSIIPTQYIDSEIKLWDACLQSAPDAESVYSKIFVSKDIDEIPFMTAAIMDENEISLFKPQYLAQFIDTAKNVMDDAFNKKMDSPLIHKLMSGKILVGLKANVVTTSMPLGMQKKDFMKMEDKKPVPVNKEYIQTIILPYLRNSVQLRSNMDKTIEMVESGIFDAMDKMNNVILTTNNLIMTNKDTVEIQSVYKVLVELVKAFIDAVKFMVCCLIRKIFIYAVNLKEYISLKDNIMRYFPNVNVFHESVMDGGYDIADEDIVHNFITGHQYMTDSIIDRILDKFKNYVLRIAENDNNENFNTLIEDQIQKTEFDLVPYKKMKDIGVNIRENIETFSLLNSDPDYTFEELKAESSLDDSIATRFTSDISEIIDIDFYTDYNGDEYITYLSILNELQYGKKFFDSMTNLFELNYDLIVKIREDISNNINNAYPNTARNNEVLDFLQVLEKDYRAFLLNIGRQYLVRLKSLENTLITNESILSNTEVDSADAYVVTEAENFVEAAMIENCIIEEIMYEYEASTFFYEAMESIIVEKKGTNPIVFFEDGEQPAEDNNAGNVKVTKVKANAKVNNMKAKTTSSTGTTSDNASGDAENKPSTKPVVNMSGSNADDKTGAGKVAGKLKDIIERVIGFLKNLVLKIKQALNKSKANIDWLKKNHDAIMAKDCSKVSVQMLPYVTNIDYIQVLTNVNDAINKIKTNKAVKMKPEDIDKLVFSKVPNRSKKSNVNINESVTQALKTGTQPLALKTYAGEELKGMLSNMYDYALGYYQSFSTKLDQAVNSITTALQALNQSESKDDDALSTNISKLATNTTTLAGVIANVAKDRANDYMTVMNSLITKSGVKQNNDNSTAEA